MSFTIVQSSTDKVFAGAGRTQWVDIGIPWNKSGYCIGLMLALTYA